jgi:hypothetical protein
LSVGGAVGAAQQRGQVGEDSLSDPLGGGPDTGAS